jgi:hypothetical protein
MSIPALCSNCIDLAELRSAGATAGVKHREANPCPRRRRLRAAPVRLAAP